MGGHTNRTRRRIAASIVTLGVAFSASAALGAAVDPATECTTNTLPKNDDQSSAPITLPFSLNFFGNTYGTVFVNNNGNVTFVQALSEFTPFNLVGTTGIPIIAPFFADVDTRAPASKAVTWGTSPDGDVFCVNWVEVGYYPQAADKLNSFQLQLVDRSMGGAPGDFDIVFNYDSIAWETGSASGGTNGFGGSSARAGYSNGSGLAGTKLELPGSGIPGSFLDSNASTGLIHNSLNTLVSGRYLFQVRAGSAPTGGGIAGRVFKNAVAAGNELAGAFVQVCPNGGGPCATSSTGANGNYSVAGLPDGDYTATAFPPPGSNLNPGWNGPITVFGGALVPNKHVVLQGPTPPPPGTTVSSIGTTPQGVPIVSPSQPFHINTTGCPNALSATFKVIRNGAVLASGTLTESPPGSGTYAGSLPNLAIGGGYADVLVEFLCPDASTQQVAFDIYIDPSGFVRTTTGEAIPGATVTLLRSDTAGGPFEQVPDGSAIMSPANRRNPDLTDATGHFGWDVIAGYYVVRASAPRCWSPADPSIPFVETAVLPVPPPVTDLDIRLACDLVAPTVTITSGPDEFVNSPDAVIGFEADEPSTLECGLNGGAYAPCVSPLALGGLPDGTHTIRIRATDAVGNVSEPKERSWTVDTVDPTIRLLNRTPGNAHGWNNTNVEISWGCEDDRSGVVADTVSATISAEGAGQSALGTCADRAGNTASDLVEDISIDRTPPSVSGSPDRAADEAGWYRAPFTVTWSGTDELSGIDACDAPVTVAGPDTGDASLTGACADRAGNTASADIPYRYDATPPLTAMDPPARIILSATLGDVLTGTASDATSGVARTFVTFTGALDTVTREATCTSGCGGTATTWSVSLAGLTPGIRWVTAHSVDAAGNTGPLTPPVMVVIAG